jgi:hypothetical protein
MNITTDYEAFVYIKEKLLEQNVRSLREDGTCVYRGHTEDIIEKSRPIDIDPDNDTEYYYSVFEDNLAKFDYNLKCAVGHIISDDVYSIYIEEQTIDNELVFKAVTKSNPKWNLTVKSVELLKILQGIHDKQNTNLWYDDFSLVEKYFNENGSYNGDGDINIIRLVK